MRLRENEIIDKLNRQQNWCRPLVPDQIILGSADTDNNEIDAIIEFSLPDGPSFKAAVELLTISTPKAISQKCNALKSSFSELRKSKLVPMIIAPYISKKQSKVLCDEGISWIDLSGNMLLNIPPGIYIERTGKPNKFPDTALIKKVYQGTSSLVIRALLLNPEGFSSLSEIVDFINNRNGKITLATVSKVLKSLEEELLITRKKTGIYVKQPQQLLENLAAGYADYSRSKKDRNYKYDVNNVDELCRAFYKADVDFACCGFYAAKIKGLGVTEQISIFIKSAQDLKKALKIALDIASPDDEFGQVTFIETKNPCVWFNSQGETFQKVVDDLELYLEMVNDRPRGPKIARQLKERIIGRFNG
jgi:hypothetical protein